MPTSILIGLVLALPQAADPPAPAPARPHPIVFKAGRDNARQFAYMVKYGLSPARAIRSATSDAAELLGRSNDIGRIAPGYHADVIAVAADPLEDVKALEKVGFAMKGGKVYRDELAGK